MKRILFFCLLISYFSFSQTFIQAYADVVNQTSQTNITDNLTEFEVGRGESVSVRVFVELMAKQSKSKSKLVFGAISSKIGEIQCSVANIEPLYKLGWKPKYDLQGLVEDMMQSDLNLMKKDEYLKQGNYKTLNYFE